MVELKGKYIPGEIISAIIMLILTLSLLTGCSLKRKSELINYSSSVYLNSDILPGPGICLLKNFQGTSVNDKFYVNWIVSDISVGCIFQLEYSENGKNFTPYYFQKGYPSNGVNNLMYCVTGSLINSDVAFFRLKAIPENSFIDNKESQKYISLYNASVIKLAKNVRSPGFNLMQSN